VKGYGIPFRLREWRWKLAGHFRRQLPAPFFDALRGARALEIGGPSPAFGRDGRLPVYRLLAGIDGCNFAAETIWGHHETGEYRPDPDGPTGRMLIREAGHLEGVADESYDALLAAHVIEHLANPVAALREWRRVLRPGGRLLLVVPHKEGTFDHRRPVTSLEHMLADDELGTAEDDLTHLEEVLRLHDLGRDSGVDDPEMFARRSHENPIHRGLHHHVFTTDTVLQLLDKVGFEVDAVEPRWREDIFCLGSKPTRGGTPENAHWLSRDAPWRRASPFRADRRPGHSRAV
jgi:SAM-dependent methyltransferase